MSELIYPEESYRIVGACFEVYNEKGNGFLESVYQECLHLEMEMQNIPHVQQQEMPLKYKGKPLVQTYKPDFVCFDKIIVEIKALPCLIDEHRAQLINYLHATGLRLGLLVNFGHYPGLQYERLVI